MPAMDNDGQAGTALILLIAMPTLWCLKKFEEKGNPADIWLARSALILEAAWFLVWVGLHSFSDVSIDFRHDRILQSISLLTIALAVWGGALAVRRIREKEVPVGILWIAVGAIAGLILAFRSATG